MFGKESLKALRYVVAVVSAVFVGGFVIANISSNAALAGTHN